jgi:hypothetical protein
MKSALNKLNANTESLLSASKAFESRATSQTKKTSSNIKKCMDAIEEYLRGSSLQGNDMSSAYAIASSATSRADSPTIGAKLAAKVAGKALGIPEEKLDVLIQMGWDGGKEALPRFIEAVHRQHNMPLPIVIKSDDTGEIVQVIW